MDCYSEYREEPQGCRPIIGVAIILAIVFAICCAFAGCKTVKTVEKVNWHDSTRYHDVYDTTHVTVTDTLHYEEHSTTTTENGTEITFGQGGGTYNSKTGEATNVTGVKENSKTNEQKSIIANLTHKVDSLSARNEKLEEQVQSYESEKQEEKIAKRSGYDRFCSWWFWITAILLLLKVACWVMEKIPATAPYVAVIRKFIPFL